MMTQLPVCLLLTLFIYTTLDHLILRYYGDGLRAFISPIKFLSVLVSVCSVAVFVYFKRREGPSNVRFFNSKCWSHSRRSTSKVWSAAIPGREARPSCPTKLWRSWICGSCRI